MNNVTMEERELLMIYRSLPEGKKKILLAEMVRRSKEQKQGQKIGRPLQ